MNNYLSEHWRLSYPVKNSCIAKETPGPSYCSVQFLPLVWSHLWHLACADKDFQNRLTLHELICTCHLRGPSQRQWAIVMYRFLNYSWHSHINDQLPCFSSYRNHENELMSPSVEGEAGHGKVSRNCHCEGFRTWQLLMIINGFLWFHCIGLWWYLTTED